MESLVVTPISKAAALQRAGRAGKPGHIMSFQLSVYGVDGSALACPGVHFRHTLSRLHIFHGPEQKFGLTCAEGELGLCFNL